MKVWKIKAKKELRKNFKKGCQLWITSKGGWCVEKDTVTIAMYVEKEESDIEQINYEDMILHYENLTNYLKNIERYKNV